MAVRPCIPWVQQLIQGERDAYFRVLVHLLRFHKAFRVRFQHRHPGRNYLVQIVRFVSRTGTESTEGEIVIAPPRSTGRRKSTCQVPEIDPGSAIAETTVAVFPQR